MSVIDSRRIQESSHCCVLIVSHAQSMRIRRQAGDHMRQGESTYGRFPVIMAAFCQSLGLLKRHGSSANVSNKAKPLSYKRQRPPANSGTTYGNLSQNCQ